MTWNETNEPSEVNKKTRLDDVVAALSGDILDNISIGKIKIPKPISNFTRHLLIVDDQKTTVKFMIRSFVSLGYQCDAAYDGGKEKYLI